jgi:hypothetical protein
MDEDTPRLQDQFRRSQRLATKTATPKEDKEDTFEFGSAVNWGEQQLRRLNVSVLKEPHYDLDKEIFRPRGSVLPAEIEERTCGYS